MIGFAQNLLTAEQLHRLYLCSKNGLIKVIKRNAVFNSASIFKQIAILKQLVIVKQILKLGIATYVMVGVIGCQSVSFDSSATSSKAFYSGEQANEIATIRTQMAAQYLKSNDLDEAKRQLEKALAVNNRYAPAYDMMGVLLQTEGSRLNVVKAESYFKQALALDPKLMKARNNYGVYLSQLGRDKEAVTQFEIAAAALGYEGRINALENLGLTALKLGDYNLATDTFIKILERDRNNLLAHLELIDLLIINNQISQATTLYTEMLAFIGDSETNNPRIIQQGLKLSL
ncbi:tetratricopeptide repeat protein [Psychrobacter sp.]|uniref:tetratricopeptide repeat protein n=1 Tax=Psychrobacter sp. TaxID=56811 RepID=UPI0025E6338B|nr:tetratricopeptide repeat protein [Psychrobacter sp.]